MNGDEEKGKKGNLWLGILQFFSNHPLLGFLGCLGSLASIVALGPAYFPWWTSPKRDLVYCINPVRTPIVHVGDISDFTVNYRGNVVTGNVTAVQVAIWNAGREPIRNTDILTTNLVLHTPNDVKILVIKTITNTSPVTGFEMTNLGKSEVNINWTILERGDTALIQIVYTGTSEVPITLEGRILGQSSPHEVKAAVMDKNVKKLASMLFALLLCFCMYLLYKGYQLLKDKPSTEATTSFKLLWLGGYMIGLWLLFYTLHLVYVFYKFFILNNGVRTPFGF